eukprot:TRINITY_DN6712_c0_g1_i1.p1 TRINITY_DN6712_c0_g1~~TRINITY_DN6712_c0_g1_i1.p1  ORF type:complete len:111 (+),score=5.43 TRINITY_DN6712_c0_g1_i1:177-509(+)
MDDTSDPEFSASGCKAIATAALFSLEKITLADLLFRTLSSQSSQLEGGNACHVSCRHASGHGKQGGPVWGKARALTLSVRGDWGGANEAVTAPAKPWKKKQRLSIALHVL